MIRRLAPSSGRSAARAVAVLVLGAASALGACSEPSEDDRRRALAEDLVRDSDGALDAATSRCVADGLIDEFGIDSLDAIVAVAEGADDPERVRVRVVDVFTECDALGAVAVPGGDEPEG